MKNICVNLSLKRIFGAPLRSAQKLARLSLNRVQVMLLVKIISTAFMVWMICLFFAFPESLWEDYKNNKP